MLAIYLMLAAAAGQAPAGPGEEQGETAQMIRKLCEAGLAPPPERFDLLVYREVHWPKKSREEFRKQAEKVLNDMAPDEAGPNIKEEREAEIEFNVNAWLEDQKVPKRYIQRIRQDGQHQRFDMVQLGLMAQLNRTLETSMPNAKLSDSYVKLGKDKTPEGYSTFQTVGATRSVAIMRKSEGWHDCPVDRWLSSPFIINMAFRFGRKAPDSDRVFCSEQKMRDFLAGASGEMVSVTTVNDPRAETPLDLVEFTDLASGRIRLSMLLDPSDYRRAYELEAHDSGGAGTSAIVKRSGFLPNGMATELEASSYHPNGELIQSDRVYVLRCDFDPVFTGDEFKLRVPPGYGLHDGRESPKKTLRAADLSAPEDGETIQTILVKGGGTVVSKNLARLGIALSSGGNTTSAPGE